MKKRRHKDRPTPAKASRPKVVDTAPRPKVVDAAPVNDPVAPLIAAGVMLVAAVVYVQTAARDIVVGDSTEFATIALTGGVAHPPGYPLLMLLARLFTWLPVGTPAFRVNLVSVAAGVATAGLIVLTARRLGASRLGAAIAGLMLAFVPVVWEWSLAIEAFALNAALAAAIVYLMVRWHQQPDRLHFLVLAALFGGLASSNHHTIVFLVPSILLMLWWHRDRLLARPFVLLLCAGAVVVGLLPYLYILWEAAKDPVLNWGNVQTFRQLVDHFLRADYGTTKLASGSTETGSPLARLLVLAASFTLLEVVLLMAGVLVAYQRARWYLWFALPFFALAGPALIAYANVDSEGTGGWLLGHFAVLPHVIMAPFAALGFTWLADQLSRRLPGKWVAESIVGVASAALIAVSMARHYRQIDQHDNHLARTFAEDILASVPPRTVLMAWPDQFVLPITFVQSVGKTRADVTLVMLGLFRGGKGKYISQLRRRHPDLVVPFNQYNRYSATSDTRAFIDANPGRPFAVVGPPLDSSFFKTHWTYQRGLVNMILPRETDVTLDQAEADFNNLTAVYRLPDPGKAKMHTYERGIVGAYAQVFMRLAQQYRLLGRTADADSLVRRAAQIEPSIRIPDRTQAK